MKKAFAMPKIVVEQFVPNEYVSACGDTEYGKYKCICDASAGTLYNYDSQNNAIKLGNYHTCGNAHEADLSSEFPEGFVDYNRNRQEDEGEHVIVWIERYSSGQFKDAHATTNINRDSWETTKS